MYLLTAFYGKHELPLKQVDELKSNLFLRPELFTFGSIEEIQAFLADQASKDPTFEGVVICDHKGQRWKIKSATYLGLHKLRGEGDNLFNAKHLLPFVLTGEDDELLTYYPEVTDAYQQLKSKVESEYEKLLDVWREHKDKESQKDFALAVKDLSLSSVLFQTRKLFGSNQTEKDLRKAFINSTQLLIKHLC
jgi:hypothetical protein